MYPIIRLRRNRKADWIRELVAETTLSPSNLILPIFVVDGHNQRQEIAALPGVYRQSIDQVIMTAKEAEKQGIKAIILFPYIDDELKNDNADEAYNLDNLVCRTIRRLRDANIGIGIISDVALDPYTSHGHDGILHDGDVDNDKTVEALCNQALVLAKSGVDIVAPSDMMDGRIIAIREELDHEGFMNVSILAYAAKYASSFYHPFRDAIGSSQKKTISKATYQMDIRNIKEAIREVQHDIEEGADLIMIKPGMLCLDVIQAASCEVNANIFAYQVSGEYAMIKFAAQSGVLNWEQSILESLMAMKRSGASAIVTYAALEVAEILNK